MAASKRVDFFYEGQRLSGEEGASIAKALFEAGVRTLSLSVKYKRPRGIHCARGRCVACHMEVDGTPGVPTCITPLREGMQVRRENFGPFYAPAMTAVARLIPFPAGFYYRMFTRPAFLRRAFLGSLRRMAGVGRLNSEPTTPGPAAPARGRASELAPRYDVVVVGAGISGMSAAATAAENGASVLLVDEYAWLGGHSLGHQPEALARARDELVGRVTAAAAVTHLPSTTAQSFYGPDTVLLGPGGSVAGVGPLKGMRRVRGSRFVFATGAYDLMPLFGNNDIAGAFGARAIRLLLERDHLVPGRRAVVYGTGEDLAAAVDLLRHHDISVLATVDPETSASPAGDAVRHLPGAKVVSAGGGGWIESVTVKGPSGRQSLACDMMCVAFPGQGAYELPFQAGFRLDMTPGHVAETRVMAPTTSTVENENGISFFVVGELAGTRSWSDKIEAGRSAAAAAAQSPTAG